MSRSLGRLTLDLVASIGSFQRDMQNASRTVSTETSRMESAANSASNAIKALLATAGVGISVSSIVSMADSYTDMTNKLKLVTTSQTQLSIAMADTHKIAQMTSSEWGGIVDVYSRYQKVAEKLGLTQEEVSRLTETTAKAVSISGASAEEASRGLLQFSQGLNLGTLRGQDLKSTMQQIPGLTNIIAEGLGVTSDKLLDMGTNGELSTEAVLGALSKMAGRTDEIYNQTATSVSASFNNIKNEAIRLIGETDQKLGASSTLVEGIKALADNLDTVTQVMGVGVAYVVGSYVPAIYTAITATATDTASKIANVVAIRAKAVADYDVAKSNLAATAAMVKAMGATNAQTAAMMTNARAAYQQAAAQKEAVLASTGLSSALLGPVGLGVAVASVAAGYLVMSNNTQKSTESLLDNNTAMDDAIAKYKELSVLKREDQLVTEREKLEQLTKEQEQANKALMAYATSMNSHNEIITQSQTEMERLYNEYRKNGDLEAFINLIKQSTLVNQSDKDELIKKASALETASQKTSTQNSLIDRMTSLQKAMADATANATAEVKAQANAFDESGEAYQKWLKKSQETIYSNAYKKHLVDNDHTPSQADAVYEAQVAIGIGVPMPQHVYDQALKTVKSTDARTASEKKYTDSIKATGKAQSDAAKEAERLRKEREREAERVRKELLDESIHLKKMYANNVTNIRNQTEEDNSLIKKNPFLSSDQKNEMLARTKRVNDALLDLYYLQLDQEYKGHLLNEEEKLKLSMNIAYARNAADKQVTDQELAYRKEMLLEQQTIDINAINKRKAEEIKALDDVIAYRKANAQNSHNDSMAELVMLPSELEKWRLQNKMGDALGGAYESYQSSVEDITQKDDLGRFKIDNEVERNRLLLEAEEAYQQEKWAIQQEYALLEEDLINQQYLDQVKLYESMLSNVTGTWTALTSVVKDAEGEQSGSYRTMFALQQGFSVASSLAAGWTAYSQAFADPSAMTVPQKFAGATAVMAAITPALATITQLSLDGFADGGYTGAGGKYDIAGLVHKGEGVLTQEEIFALGGPSGFEALRKSIRNGFADGGYTGGTNFSSMPTFKSEPSLKVVVNTLPDTTANVSRGSDGTVTIDIVDKKIKQAFTNLRDRNSHESKALRAGYAVSPM